MKTYTFEEAYSRIQTIAETMENPNTTIQQSVDLYKEASLLLAQCYQILETAKIEVQHIKVESNHEL